MAIEVLLTHGLKQMPYFQVERCVELLSLFAFLEKAHDRVFSQVYHTSLNNF